jgi:hypothetical protein
MSHSQVKVGLIGVRQWSTDEWRKRREPYGSDAAAFEAHTVHLF